MPLLSLRDIHLAHGGPELLDGVRLQIERGERICLLGRNGAGKSTLMNVIAGELEPDDGEIVRQQGVTVAHLPQGWTLSRGLYSVDPRGTSPRVAR